MLYHYFCKSCGKKEDKEFKMGEALEIINCECGGKMYQNILGKRIQSHLPEDYIATSEYHSVDFGGSDEEMEAMLSI